MKKNTVTVIFVVIISVLSLVVFSHIDCAYICEWSIQLIDHAIEGKLASYATDLNAIGIGVNYSLFSIIANAIFLLPVYIITLFMPVDLIVFEFWLKLVLLGINMLISYEIYEICQIKGKEKQFSVGVGCLFLLSPFVQIFSVGMGQIEAIAVLLIMIGIKNFLKGNYIKASIFAGISLLFKVFTIFIIIPFVLLYYKKSLKSFVCIMCVSLVYIFDKIISYLLIPDFFVKTSATNNADFISRVFEIEVNNIYVYIGIVIILCAVCVYCNLEKKVKIDSWLIYSLLFLLTFFVFVDFSVHWMMLVYVFMVVGMAISDRNYNTKLVLILGINIFTSIISVIGCGSVVTAVYPGRSMLSLIVNRTEEMKFISGVLAKTIENYEYAGNVAFTIILVLITLYIVLTIFESIKKEAALLNDNKRINSFLISLNFVPVMLAYTTIGLFYYFG